MVAGSCLEDVPFRMTVSFIDSSVGEEKVLNGPELEMPNCTKLLMCMMPDFSLERKVLYWVDSASQQESSRDDVAAGVAPTAPPCWLLLVDPKENFAAGSSKAKDEAPVQGAVTLGPATGKGRQAGRTGEGLDPEEQGGSEGEDSSPTTSGESDGEEPLSANARHIPSTLPRFLSLPQCRPKTSPMPLAGPSEGSCPKPPLLRQRQSMLLFHNVKDEWKGAKEKLSAFMHPSSHAPPKPTLAARAFSLHQRSRSSRTLRYGSPSDVPLAGTLTPTPPHRRPLAAAGFVPPIRTHKPTIASLSPYSCLPPTRGAQQPLGSHGSHPDSTADLLSALSQEERDLIEPVLALGYPIRRAILALQKTGRQSLGQFLRYLSACDKLLNQGYEEAQVEEAMEMFQNSEKKAAEFLHLLAQFDDMGFPQADIKEVLLLCENHRDRALEELMLRTQ
ncbi:ubiquitin-associated protein 1-like [Varanus komodoensis]|uniref:ubiquitin-associated protein 1-like n=1 Tax=Varanus komodoensis TaxID=61221 RepID=UPI001CF76CD0|nr:ubiquitin-associated protein 1-like [Varanus komodoensis]